MRTRTTFTALFFLIVTITMVAAEEDSAVDLYRKGGEAQMEENYYRAIELYRQSLDINSTYADSMLALAECYFYLDEYEASLEWVQRARDYRGDDPDILNLEARIRMGMGDVKTADRLFASVLDMEPNNLSAIFGRAELDIVSGRVQNAARTYEEALRISPDNSKALLSLVLVYDSLGETEKAEYFAGRALELHSDSAPVHYITARHFFRNGNMRDAEYHVRTALSMNPSDYSAMLLLSNIYLRTGRYDEVVELCNELLGKNRKEPLTWYLLGIASWKLERYEDARYYLNEAVHLQPDDDMARIAMEQLLIDNFEVENKYRQDAALYHFELGKRYTEKNLVMNALREFRRGLMINPYSEEGRLLYGRIFRDMGNIPKYVSVLQVLINEGSEKRDVLDDYEIYKSLLSDTVAYSWDFDQFSHQRDMYEISIFYLEDSYISDHPESDYCTARYFRNLLFAYETINPRETLGVKGFAEAYHLARNGESEYFIILDVHEVERIVSLQCTMYNSETGTEVFSDSILRTGNHRIPDAFTKAAAGVANFLPPRGRILERAFNTALIDLGSADGVKEGDVLDIIRRGRLEISAKGSGFEYKEADRLGEYTVTAVDYLVSEGTVTRKAFFDMINQYDHVIPGTTEENGREAEDNTLPIDLYRMLLSIP